MISEWIDLQSLVVLLPDLWILPIFAFVVLVAVQVKRETGRVSRSELGIGLFTVGYLLGDWVLLVLPPLLQLSFGPPHFSWLVMAFVRLSTLLFMAVVFRIVRGRTGSLPDAFARWLWGGALLLNLALTLALGYALYVEPFRLTTTYLEFRAAGVVPAGSHLRIVQVSDLHMERWTKREMDVLDEIATLEPDLIVLTGDYLNLSYLDDPRTLADTRAFLSRLHAPYGVYAIQGTVDKGGRMERIFAGLDVTVLEDEVVEVPVGGWGRSLYVVGLADLGTARDRAALPELMEEIPGGAFSLLLYHRPDVAEVAAQEGVDLYLAGHTHGGQVRLPLYGALVTFSDYGKRFEQGRYELDETTLYVSRGLGMEGWLAPRVRFLCPPEIVVIDVF